MIQRIQSIFLALSAITLGMLFKLPFASSSMATSQFLSDKIYDIQDHPVLLVLCGLAIVSSIAAIFLFKNRNLQLRIGILSIISCILLIITAIVLFYNEANSMDANAAVEDSAGLYMPILAIIFSGLAVRFIKKDENLVRSADRLR